MLDIPPMPPGWKPGDEIDMSLMLPLKLRKESSDAQEKAPPKPEIPHVRPPPPPKEQETLKVSFMDEESSEEEEED